MTKTSLRLPRACSHCARPAVVHLCVPGDGHSHFLCAEHVISTERSIERSHAYLPGVGLIAGEPAVLHEAAVEYPDPLTIPVVRAEDDDMADWEPCQGVSYPDGYYSGPYPCEDLAEPGEELCVRCRNQR